MFYKVIDPGGYHPTPYNVWQKTWWPTKEFLSRLRLNIQIRWNGFANTKGLFYDGTTACYLGIINLGVANRNEYVYPHYQWADKNDEIHGTCSGILRLGKKSEHTVLWCPKCASIVRQPGEAQGDDAFLKGLRISPR